MSKTCRFFLQGFCRNGNNCQFEHQNVIRERDGNVSKTFANSQDNKIDGRRIADVRQRYLKSNSKMTCKMQKK